MAQDIWGNRYSSTYIISDKQKDFVRSIIAENPIDYTFKLEVEFTPSDTAYFLHYFANYPKAPISKNRKMLFKLKNNQIVEISAYSDSKIVSDTIHNTFNFAHAHFNQVLKMDKYDMCAHYQITYSQLINIINNDIQKIRVEDDLSFEDYRIPSLSKRFAKMYEAIQNEILTRNYDLREGL